MSNKRYKKKHQVQLRTVDGRVGKNFSETESSFAVKAELEEVLTAKTAEEFRDILLTLLTINDVDFALQVHGIGALKGPDQDESFTIFSGKKGFDEESESMAKIASMFYHLVKVYHLDLKDSLEDFVRAVLAAAKKAEKRHKAQTGE